MIKLFLILSLSALAQFVWVNTPTTPQGPPTCCGGIKGSTTNTDPGKPGTGFGAGGGSSGWAGGNGGDGFQGGGGGGGVGGYGAGGLRGGAGGVGAVVIKYFTANDSIIGSEIRTADANFIIPIGVGYLKSWVIGGGGGLRHPLHSTGAKYLEDLSLSYKPMFHYVTVRRDEDKLHVFSHNLKDDFSGFDDGFDLKVPFK